MRQMLDLRWPIAVHCGAVHRDHQHSLRHMLERLPERALRGLATADRVCLPLSVCNDDECLALTVCDRAGGTKYQLVPPTPVSDRRCASVRQCADGFEEVQAPTCEDDRVCAFDGECSTRTNFNLIFVIDASGSVGAANFDIMKNIIIRYIDALEVGPGQVQIGVTVYGNDVSIPHSHRHHPRAGSSSCDGSWHHVPDGQPGHCDGDGSGISGDADRRCVNSRDASHGYD